MDPWFAEDGELKVIVEGDCEPRLWRKFKNIEVSVVDTRECPGMAVSVASAQAIEIVHLIEQWNAEAERERSVRPDGWRGPIVGSLRTDRNAPCACGSGRKSKKCCGGVK
jgi:uncharacterized protein YchJ